jgi:hypothetical protein
MESVRRLTSAGTLGYCAIAAIDKKVERSTAVNFRDDVIIADNIYQLDDLFCRLVRFTFIFLKRKRRFILLFLLMQ